MEVQQVLEEAPESLGIAYEEKKPKEQLDPTQHKREKAVWPHETKE